MYRPLKELKGFVKVGLKAGEKKSVSVKLTSRAFAYYSTADDCWRVNDGEYRIIAGSSSRDERLSSVITVRDGKTVSNI